MADLTITAASVLKSTGEVIDKTQIAGETITPGQAVYLKSTDKRVYKAQADGTAEEATVLGIAQTGAAAGQRVYVQTGGEIAIGATIVVTTEYVVSATAGGIAPRTDLVTGNRYSRIGYGSVAGKIQMDIKNTGTTVP
jgi:predicted transcriptional regulator